MSREQTIEILWPELSPEIASNRFHQTLHAARRALSPSGDEQFIRLRRGTLSIQAPGGLTVDVEAFEAAAKRALDSNDQAAYDEALALYGGELLPDDIYEDWAAERRESLRQTYLTLLMRQAEVSGADGQLEEASRALRQVIGIDPVHEEAYVHLMRLYALAGQRPQALHLFHQLRTALQQELEVPPDDESQRLYHDILTGRFPVPPAPEGTATATTPNNLPTFQTTFIGREREIAEVMGLVTAVPARPPSGSRLVTLTGTGGCGKTRLALAVATELLPTFAGGIWLVELASVSDPNLVASAVAQSLGIHEEPGRNLTASLSDALHEQRCLLILDNCEHLIDACADLVTLLLTSCPEICILATSREPLHVAGEIPWQVPPLSAPSLARSAADSNELVADVARSESVKLFIERTASIMPGVAVTPENAAALAKICRQVDGLPLAIELAAARVNALSIEQIADRLNDRFRLLKSSDRGAVARHQTLLAAIEWSYDLLTPDEQSLFNRLSVFPGSFTLAAAEAIGRGDDLANHDVLDLLSQLIDKSLVGAEGGATDEVRYRLLDTLRQFGRDQLAKRGETDSILRRHAAYYTQLANGAEEALSGPDQRAWFERLEREHTNLRAVLQWLLSRNDAREGLKLCVELWRFWSSHWHLDEGRRWLSTFLEIDDQSDLELHVDATFGCGRLAYQDQDYETARRLMSECLTLAQCLGDGEFTAAAYTQLGHIARQQGDFGAARDLLQQAVEIRRSRNDTWGTAVSMMSLGMVALACDDDIPARELFIESLAMFQDTGDLTHISRTQLLLGRLVHRLGDTSEAESFLRAGLSLSNEIGELADVTSGLIGFARLALDNGQPEIALQITSFATRLRSSRRLSLLPTWQAWLDSTLELARSALPDHVANAAWEAGEALSIDEAVTLALERA